MKNQTDHFIEHPIGGLFLRLSVPIVFGLLVNGLYTIADAAFVARVEGANAIGGISVVFPLQMALYAFASLLGTGAASIISRALGANELHKAQQAAITSVILTLVLALCFCLIILLRLPETLMSFGATPALLPYAQAYATPIIGFTLGMMLSNVLAELLRAEGKMKVMSAMFIGASLLNLTLDAWFILGLGWGVEGAAYATVLAQASSLSIAGYVYVKKQARVKIHVSHFRPNLIRPLVLLGIPAFVGNIGVAATIALTNILLHDYASDIDLTLAAYGLTTRITLFIVMPLIGMMISFQTLCGFNYGANAIGRVKAIVRLAVITTSCYAIACTLLMLLAPHWVLGLFTKDALLIEQAGQISRYIFLGFATAGCGFIIGAMYQAIGKAKAAIFLSTARLLIFLFPLLFILPYSLGENGIWLAFPIADFFAFLLSLLFWRKQNHRFNRRQQAQPD